MRIPTFNQFQREADVIAVQFERLSRLEGEAASGQKILASSDDPTLAYEITSMQDYLDTLSNYSDNGALAISRSTLFSTSAQSGVNLMTQLQSLIKQANSVTGSTAANRQAIAQQMIGLQESLLNVASTQDAFGSYIYSGANSTVSPYTLVNGTYQYQGGTQTSSINVGPGVSATYYDVGDNIFGSIFNGNGTYAITANSSNTGNAYTSAGSVLSGYIPDTYTLAFSLNSSNQLVYSVNGVTSGQVIPPPPSSTLPIFNSSASGTDISFNGVDFSVLGMPNAGDSFQIQPSTQVNIFNTIQSLTALLQNPPASTAIFNQQLSQLNATAETAFTQMTSYLSQTGVNSGVIQNQCAITKETIFSQTAALSELADANPATVYSELMQQSIALQATQDAFLKIQETLTKLLKL
ncbi:MAG: flagellar hook-associated protein FlgL [Gammaproteobacteria bacterium]